MSKSEKLPDQWGEIGSSSYTMAAMAAVYDLMAKDGLLPAEGAGKHPVCGHPLVGKNSCSEMRCVSYYMSIP